MVSYDYAQELGPLNIEGFGDNIDDSIRLFPLASQYFRLNHSGGPIYILVEEPIDDLVISLHPVTGGALEGPVLASADSITNIPGNTHIAFKDETEFDAGGYFLVLVRSHYEGQSKRIRFCAGTHDSVAGCRTETEAIPDKENPANTDHEPPTAWSCHTTNTNTDFSILGLLLWLWQKKRRSEDRLNS